MLDALGLTRRDSEGLPPAHRRRRRLRLALTTYSASWPSRASRSMIVEQWNRSASAARCRRWSAAWHRTVTGQEHQIYFETQWGADNIYGHVPLIFPRSGTEPLGPLMASGIPARAARGKQPPPRMRELMAIYRRSFSVPDRSARAWPRRSGRSRWTSYGSSRRLDSPASQGVRP